MIEIDGSAGGGQLLRSALSMAALTGEAVEMTGIRGDRPTPGLKRQHLAVVELVAEVCDATVSSVEVGTEALTFEPGPIQPGEYAADIGTAGSVTLLFDAVLPLATAIDGPLSVTARGGTAVKWSPTAAHYRRTKLPLLRRRGLRATVEVARPGFYPEGGGEATLWLAPASCSAVDLTERGAREGVRVESLASTDLEDGAVAERQAERATERLENAGLPVVERTVRYAEADSTGASLAVDLAYERGRAGFDALGEPGKPAEDVADDAVEAALRFEDGTAPVDRHTADQLLVFLALAGGRLRVPAVTDHVATNRDLLAAFGFDLTIDREGDGAVLRG
jgi:RNA 3'-terminal phosphate cyclase (ATP)